MKEFLLLAAIFTGVAAAYNIGRIQRQDNAPVPAPTATVSEAPQASSLLLSGEGYVRALCYYKGQDGNMYPLEGPK